MAAVPMCRTGIWLFALSAVAAHDRRAAPSSPLSVCALPPTRHLNYSDACSAHADIAAPNISWAAQRGEYESAQVLLTPPHAGTLSVAFSDLVAPTGATLDKRLLSWRQQGYVFVRHTSRYADSGCPGNRDCWRPDPLLPPAADNTIAFEANVERPNQPLWITVQVPRNATPAAQSAPYVGSLTLTFVPSADGSGTLAATLPITLEVWPVTVPTTDQATVQHDWNFGASKVLGFYPDQPVGAVATKWWQFMEDHRIPPMDRSAWECLGGSTDPICSATVKDASSFLEGKTKVLVSGLHSPGCNCSSPCPAEVAKQNAVNMKPVVQAAKAVRGAALLGYAFDERPRSCEKSIRAAFGAFLDEYPVEKYPEVGGTMAALNWAGSGGNSGPTGSHPSDGGMPLDMPFTDWVLQYQYYNQTTADAWVNSAYKGRNRSMWLYHCIEPSGIDYLNIFIERPLIHARLLFWLASTQNIQGWLYWATDLWVNCPTSPHAWQHKNITVMRRINGTSMFTDFLADSVIWCGQKLFQFWVNGDGYYMYPGPDGPISTSRLESIRDALEDMELFRSVTYNHA